LQRADQKTRTRFATASCAAGGERPYRYVEAAVQLALDRQVPVIVPRRSNKAAMHAAGHHFDGHTELLAHFTGANHRSCCRRGQVDAPFTSPRITSLRNAAEKPTMEALVATVRAGHQHFRELGVANPRIAVAGLIRIGEAHFRREEIDRIQPPSKRQERKDRRQGADLGDTLFYRALKGEFDLVVAQYHDQAYPEPSDCLRHHGERQPGLPSAAFGGPRTAHDIAWTQGEQVNMKAAIAYARRWRPVVRKKKKFGLTHRDTEAQREQGLGRVQRSKLDEGCVIATDDRDQWPQFSVLIFGIMCSVSLCLVVSVVRAEWCRPPGTDRCGD